MVALVEFSMPVALFEANTSGLAGLVHFAYLLMFLVRWVDAPEEAFSLLRCTHLTFLGTKVGARLGRSAADIAIDSIAFRFIRLY